jgi:hypothetical protein
MTIMYIRKELIHMNRSKFRSKNEVEMRIIV